MNPIFLRFIIFLTPLFSWSQIPYYTTINVISEISTGQISATHTPFDIGVLNEVFDGSTSSLVRTPSINPMIITLDFQRTVSFDQTHIMNGAGNATWTIELANSLNDLNSGTGSYQMLFNQEPIVENVWDIRSIGTTARLFRLTLHRTTGDDYVHLREWKIVANEIRMIENICVSPSVIHMPTDSHYQPGIYLVDTSGNYLQVPPSLFTWSGSIPSVCEVDSLGNIRSFSAFSTTDLHVAFETLQATIPIYITSEYTPEKAAVREVKVALVVIDPPSPVFDGNTFSQHFNWENPAFLSQKLCDSLNAASGGVVHYSIYHTYEDTNLYTIFGNTQITADSLAMLLLEPNWTTLHDVAETQGQSAFLYNDLLNHYNFCNMSDQEIIDEVWVYAMPFVGLYESRLTGDNAFFYNSPPLLGNSCSDHLPIMGFNYERGLAEAWHSYGHRVESAMVQLFGDWDNLPPLNPFDLYTLRHSQIADSGQVGNIHFPVNATADYQYESTTNVTSYAENWLSYPFLFQQHETINCTAWNCSHLGYMSWWHRHLPNKRCLDQNGFLNNWWSYVVDFNEGKTLEMQTDICNCNPFAFNGIQEQDLHPLLVSPNPTDGLITFATPETAKRLEIFSLSGNLSFNIPVTTWNEADISHLPSGTYLGKLLTKEGNIHIFRIVRL